MENNNIFDEAIKFLLWSYFKISVDYNAEKVVKCAIERAYIDAVSHVLSLEEGNDGKDASKAKDNSVKLLLELIENFPESNDWHKTICVNLVKNYENIKGNIKKNSKQKYEMKFTIGIAQKWVNMTLKYIYLLYGIYYEKYGIDNGFCMQCQSVIENKDKLHVPLDSIILKGMKSINIKLDKAWSRIDDYKIYENAQNELKKYCEKEQITPIEWENQVWIKMITKQNNS